MIFALLLGLAAAPVPTSAERTAIFKAAGFTPTAGKYLMCDGRGPLLLETRDINGDGRLDALILDGGTKCYGMVGEGYTLLTESAHGRWTTLDQRRGIPSFLKTRANGWPDIEVGGPGFCFSVLRWTGREFTYHRSQYDGKPCRG